VVKLSHSGFYRGYYLDSRSLVESSQRMKLSPRAASIDFKLIRILIPTVFKVYSTNTSLQVVTSEFFQFLLLSGFTTMSSSTSSAGSSTLYSLSPQVSCSSLSICRTSCSSYLFSHGENFFSREQIQAFLASFCLKYTLF
jgi:hypothetical protein